MDGCMSMKKVDRCTKKKREMDGCMSMKKKNIVDGQNKKEEKWTDACP